MKITRIKTGPYLTRWESWAVSWCDLFDGLVGILSFGHFHTHTSFTYTTNSVKKHLKRRIAQQEKENLT